MRWSLVSSRPNLLFLLTAALLLPGCKTQPQTAGPHLYAVVRFENLTGRASDEWIGRAVSEALPRSLQGALDGPVLFQQAIARVEGLQGARPTGIPGLSADRTAAISAGANRVIYGTVTGPASQPTVTAYEEDVATRKILFSTSSSGHEINVVIAKLASAFSPKARPVTPAKPEALQFYAEAAELPFTAAIPLLTKSVEVEPDFGLGWISLIAANRAVGNRSGAEAALQPAAKAKLSPLDQATLELETAILHNDPVLRTEAIRKVAANSPGDVLTQRTIAQQLASAGEIAAAAAVWKLITETKPEDVAAWNELSYSRAFAGDKTGALDAIAQYAKLRPEDVNALDSRADIHYLFGDFKEAQKGYLAANTRQPAFLNGGELYKAAFAAFKAGDKAGADALFEKFRAAREQAKETQTLPLYAASWLFQTGRKAEGFSSLQKATASAPAELKGLYAAQLSIWAVMDHARPQAASIMKAAGPIRSGGAAASLLIAQPSQPEAAWTTLADRMFPGPQAAGLHDTALGFALLLDNHRAAAIPVWKRLVSQKTTFDPLVILILRKLEGKPALQLPPDPVNYNQFAAVFDSL